MATDEPIRRRQIRILLADDDETILTIVQTALRLDGFEVVCAHDGDEAVRLAAEHYPALAVLDLMMPGVDGYEIARRLRAHRALRGIPILMVTARVQDSDVARGFEVGADDYLKKPFGPAELRARVKAVLARAEDA